LLDQVDGAVIDLHVHRHLRVLAQECRDGSRHRRLRQRLRTSDAQQALRCIGIGSGHRHGPGQFQHGAAARQRGVTSIGQAQPAGAPVQQAGAGPRFHFSQVTRDHGARHVERVRRRNHAAALGDGDKHACGGNAIHDSSDWCN
jgi:hypothetical protein